MNKETTNTFVDIQLSNYIGEICIFCRHSFHSVKDIREKNIVSAGKNISGDNLFSCKECWKNHIKQGDVSSGNDGGAE